MFKGQLLRRNFSLFNRVPHARVVRSAVRDGHDSVNVQRFRIQKPFFGKSRLIGAIAVLSALYGVTRYISIEVEVEEVQDDKSRSTRPGKPISNEEGAEDSAGEESEEEYEDDEDDDDALLFLPTGFSRPKPKTFYKGSDPEWQEFRKVATDRPRVEKIRNELSAMIRNVAKKSPGYATHLGTIDTNKGKAWIELRFPDGPPTEFERPGIELTEDLEWRKATRPVEELHHQRLSKLLYPSEAGNVLYQEVKRKAGLSWKGFRTYMGWEVKSEPATVQSVIQKVLADPPTPSGIGAPTTQATPTSPASEGKQPTEVASPLGSPAKDVRFALPDAKKLTLDLTQFRQDFRKTAKPYAIQPARGTFIVIGLVEVYGERARMTLNVAATYDPKQGRYMSLQASVWNLVKHRQSPRGGP
ncbi:hypothetical protein CC86DRAFT_342165 [Ophiobolus disseminans]|uniref:Uncharacterized protein n=1 Tax=Ophiobolus disseminans TaxID=1469910 RepID=A0A6A7AFN6_9PLEO|nr:hypothetical protein CC86DRAFT_342165 [Ophiobolus disseminans]